MENHKGRADAFSTFSPFKSRFSRFKQWLVYACSPERDSEIRARGFLHFAYWTTLRHRDLRAAGVPDVENPAHGALLFVSAFVGAADEYVSGFSEHLHDEMDALWSQSEQWEGAGDLTKLNQFIVRHRRRVNLFFNAYPDDVKGVRNALTLRRKLDELADAEAANSPSGNLGDALATLARSLEGVT